MARVDDAAPLNPAKSGEDRGPPRVRLPLPPQRDEVVHVRSRVPLDSVLAERLPEAALRDFFQGEEGFTLRAEEVPVPGCEERLRIERELVVIAHGARDANYRFRLRPKSQRDCNGQASH